MQLALVHFMMELNHLGCGIGTSIFLALQKLYLVNGMNISAVINNTMLMNHIMSKQIASEIVGLSLCGEEADSFSRNNVFCALSLASVGLFILRPTERAARKVTKDRWIIMDG